MNSTPPPFVSPETIRPSRRNIFGNGNVTVARRQNHTATLLHNGMVLIAGGNGDAGGLASADVYDPATGEFSVTGSMSTARAWHTATLLRNGNVLIAGGAVADYTTLLLHGPSRAWNYANSAERECHSFRVAPPCRDFCRLKWAGHHVKHRRSSRASPQTVPGAAAHRLAAFGLSGTTLSASAALWLTPAVGTKGLHLYTSRRWPILITRTTSRRSSMVYRMR